MNELDYQPGSGLEFALRSYSHAQNLLLQENKAQTENGDLTPATQTMRESVLASMREDIKKQVYLAPQEIGRLTEPDDIEILMQTITGDNFSPEQKKSLAQIMEIADLKMRRTTLCRFMESTLKINNAHQSAAKKSSK